MNIRRRSALRALSLLLAAVLGVAGLTLVSAPAVATPGVDDYPARLKASARDALVDPWNFYNRECTSFVAWRLNNDNKVAFTNQYGQPSGDRWSNAVLWKPAALRAGILVNSTPAVGAVAWWSSGRMGHVAWVEQASSSSITIEEYNYVHAGGYSVRVITKSSSSWPDGFIHVKDLALKSTGVPRISGTARVGSKLTATAGTWSTSGATYRYQWLAGGAAVAGATASTFTPTAAQYAKTLQVKVTGTLASTSATAASATTAVVAAGAAPSATRTPAITGTAQVGSTLTASTGTWSGSGSTYAVQWLADGAPISGATGSTYVPDASVLGAALTVQVSASQIGYATGSSTSAATTAVAPGTIAATTVPAISGTPEVGSALTADPGSWSVPSTTYSYQWMAAGVVVPGATTPSFVPSPSTVAKTVTVKVTAARSGYRNTTATSPATTAVLPGQISSTLPPTISGLPRTGARLTASPGTWSIAGATYRYQWLADGRAIAGATGSTYTTSQSLLGRRIAVIVTATKPGYTQASSTSVATGAVSNGAVSFRGAPTIVGTAVAGHLLTVRPGTYAPSNARVSYQWLRNGVRIRGAVHPSYRVTSADRGWHLSATITLSRSGWLSTARATRGTRRVQVQSTVAVRTVAKPGQRFRLTVRIRAAGVSSPGGQVRIGNGSRVVGHGRVTHGRLVLTTARLTRGRHVLRVAYASGNTIMLPRTATVIVRVR